jgi:hypothetical protein
LNESWRTLNAKINRLTEQEVYDLLQQEINTTKRLSMLQRLHQRYCTLRAARERVEILRGAEKV